jgi:hypothetical protein
MTERRWRGAPTYGVSTTSKSWVTVAVFDIITDAEQYFSADKLDGAFDLFGVEATARDDEMHVDAGEDLGVGFGAVGVDLDPAVGDRLAAFLKDMYDIIGGTAAGADQQQLHRAWAGLGGRLAVGGAEGDGMAAFGLADKGAIASPGDASFHVGAFR